MDASTSISPKNQTLCAHSVIGTSKGWGSLSYYYKSAYNPDSHHRTSDRTNEENAGRSLHLALNFAPLIYYSGPPDL